MGDETSAICGLKDLDRATSPHVDLLVAYFCCFIAILYLVYEFVT